MRLVYLDEAGISNAKQEPWLVVAGVAVHADNQLVQIERHLDRLVAKHIPAELQPNFVFHATELFNGGKTIRRDDPRFPLRKRLHIASDLANVPRKFGLPVTIGFVERAAFPITKDTGWETLDAKGQVVAQHVTAFMNAAMQADLWMRRSFPSEVCMLVVEDNSDARALIRDTQNHHQQRDRFVGAPDEITKYFPLRKIKEDPLFQAKRKSSVLQVADFIAYTFKRFLMGDIRCKPFVDKFRHLILVSEDAPPVKGTRQPDANHRLVSSGRSL